MLNMKRAREGPHYYNTDLNNSNTNTSVAATANITHNFPNFNPSTGGRVLYVTAAAPAAGLGSKANEVVVSGVISSGQSSGGIMAADNKMTAAIDGGMDSARENLPRIIDDWQMMSGGGSGACSGSDREVGGASNFSTNFSSLQKMIESEASAASVASIDSILKQVQQLNELERLLLYLKLPTTVPTAPAAGGLLTSPAGGGLHTSAAGGGNQQQPMPLVTESVKNRAEDQLTITWIRTHLTLDPEVSLLKNEVFSEYEHYCAANHIKLQGRADFGKLMKQVFPNLKPRRLGHRGASKYCYSGLKMTCNLPNPDLSDVFREEPNYSCKQEKCCWASSGQGISSSASSSSQALNSSDQHLNSSATNVVLEWAGKVMASNGPALSNTSSLSSRKDKNRAGLDESKGNTEGNRRGTLSGDTCKSMDSEGGKDFSSLVDLAVTLVKEKRVDPQSHHAMVVTRNSSTAGYCFGGSVPVESSNARKEVRLQLQKKCEKDQKRKLQENVGSNGGCNSQHTPVTTVCLDKQKVRRRSSSSGASSRNPSGDSASSSTSGVSSLSSASTERRGASLYNDPDTTAVTTEGSSNDSFLMGGYDNFQSLVEVKPKIESLCVSGSEADKKARCSTYSSVDTKRTSGGSITGSVITNVGRESLNVLDNVNNSCHDGTLQQQHQQQFLSIRQSNEPVIIVTEGFTGTNITSKPANNIILSKLLSNTDYSNNNNNAVTTVGMNKGKGTLHKIGASNTTLSRSLSTEGYHSFSSPEGDLNMSQNERCVAYSRRHSNPMTSSAPNVTVSEIRFIQPPAQNISNSTTLNVFKHEKNDFLKEEDEEKPISDAINQLRQALRPIVPKPSGVMDPIRRCDGSNIGVTVDGMTNVPRAVDFTPIQPGGVNSQASYCSLNRNMLSNCGTANTSANASPFTSPQMTPQLPRSRHNSGQASSTYLTPRSTPFNPEENINNTGHPSAVSTSTTTPFVSPVTTPQYRSRHNSSQNHRLHQMCPLNPGSTIGTGNVGPVVASRSRHSSGARRHPYALPDDHPSLTNRLQQRRLRNASGGISQSPHSAPLSPLIDGQEFRSGGILQQQSSSNMSGGANGSDSILTSDFRRRHLSAGPHMHSHIQSFSNQGLNMQSSSIMSNALNNQFTSSCVAPNISNLQLNSVIENNNQSVNLEGIAQQQQAGGFNSNRPQSVPLPDMLPNATFSQSVPSTPLLHHNQQPIMVQHNPEEYNNNNPQSISTSLSIPSSICSSTTNTTNKQHFNFDQIMPSSYGTPFSLEFSELPSESCLESLPSLNLEGIEPMTESTPPNMSPFRDGSTTLNVSQAPTYRKMDSFSTLPGNDSDTSRIFGNTFDSSCGGNDNTLSGLNNMTAMNSNSAFNSPMNANNSKNIIISSNNSFFNGNNYTAFFTQSSTSSASDDLGSGACLDVVSSNMNNSMYCGGGSTEDPSSSQHQSGLNQHNMFSPQAAGDDQHHKYQINSSQDITLNELNACNINDGSSSAALAALNSNNPSADAELSGSGFEDVFSDFNVIDVS